MYPKISILIPAYQAEKYLERCLNSVFQQTYQNLEIILIDDGSTDGTEAIARELIKTHKNLKLWSYSHKGLSTVRNLLIEKSSGDYLFFLDADDFLSPNAIMILYQTAIQYEAEIVQCEMERTTGDIITDTSDHGIALYTRDEALKAYNRTRSGPRCMSAGKLYKKEVFQDIRYPNDGRTQEDEYVAFLLIDKCHRFAVVKQKLYGYYRNPDSIMNKPFSAEHYHAIPAIQNSIAFYRDLQMPEQVLRIQFRYLTILQSLYQKTMQYLPENTAELDYFMEEYKKTLPFVQKNLPLPDHILADFLIWPQKPLTTKVNRYWYYVETNILTE